MSRIIRILGLAMLLTALLVVSTAGTVLAAEGEGNQPDGWPYYGDCPDCVPEPYLGPGPHGHGEPQKGQL